MKNKIRYTCAGYGYAPESFKCYMVVINANGYNHSYYELKNFTDEENQEVGNICICKGKREAEATIKKIVRSKKEYYNNITYGYKLLNESRMAYLEYHKIVDDADIQEKLKLYKEVKEYFKSINYIVDDYTFTSCKLGENYKPIDKKKIQVRAILNTTPIKIKFIRSKEQ